MFAVATQIEVIEVEKKKRWYMLEAKCTSVFSLYLSFSVFFKFSTTYEND